MAKFEKPISSRQAVVAKAYVEGLERDRFALRAAEEKLVQTIWEVVQLGGYNRALFTLMHEIVRAYDAGALTTELIERAEDLLAANKPLHEAIWNCPCGHSTYDHDEKGCQYLGCKPICGKVANAQAA